MLKLHPAAALVAAIFIGACSGTETPAQVGPPGAFAADAGLTPFMAQVAAGQAAYGLHCAKCHGASGEGGVGPRLVGLDQGALPLDPPPDRKVRHTQFVTAGDVARFVVANM